VEIAVGYGLEPEAIEWFMAACYPDGAPAEWRAAPMLAASHAGVAPALIITAEYDPLRDEGEDDAVRLEADGVPAKATRYDGLIHGFLGMGPVVPAANAAVDEAGAALREALHDEGLMRTGAHTVLANQWWAYGLSLYRSMR
jgi:acetyl esterase